MTKNEKWALAVFLLLIFAVVVAYQMYLDPMKGYIAREQAAHQAEPVSPLPPADHVAPELPKIVVTEPEHPETEVMGRIKELLAARRASDDTDLEAQTVPGAETEPSEAAEQPLATYVPSRGTDDGLVPWHDTTYKAVRTGLKYRFVHSGVAKVRRNDECSELIELMGRSDPTIVVLQNEKGYIKTHGRYPDGVVTEPSELFRASRRLWIRCR